MKKILKLFGFTQKKYTWNDLDPDIKMQSIRKFACSLFLLVLSIILLIYTKNISSFLMVMFLAIIYAGISVHYLLFFYYAKFDLLVGECVDISRPSSTIGKKVIMGRCTMVLKCNESCVEIPISYSSKYRTGMTIAVYTTQNSIVQRNTDFYKIENPLAMSIVNTKNSYENKEKSN